MSKPEEPRAQRRLAAAFGVPVLTQSEPDPVPGPARLHQAAGAGRLRPWLTVGIVLAVLALVALGSAMRSRPEPVGGVLVSGPAAAATAASPDAASTGDAGVSVVVHVAGSVAAPGVVTLPSGSRVAEAVAAAGGALPGTSMDGLNLARRLTDGEQVVVGAAAPAAAASGAPAPAPASGQASGEAQVDLNTASSEELQELPRVGPATAEKIIDYREQNGRFSTVDQLLEVPGIGERTLEGMRDKVRV